MADRAVLRTVCMASTVDRLLRKPYCESARPAGPSVWASRRPTMILSRILPAVSNIHSGRYDDGSAVGLPGFSIRTSLCRFQRAGKHPSLRHAVKTRRKLSKQASTAALRAVLGIPSGPGAAPILTRRYAHRSSSTPTSGIRCSSSTGGALISRGMTDGNSVDTARRTKSGAVGGDVLGALRRDMTVLYGLPHTSRSASSQSCLQQRRLLAFIALRSRLRASVNSSRQMTSSGRPLNRLAAPAITPPRHGGVACAHDCGHEFVHHVLCGTQPDLHLRHDLSKAITVESSCAPPTVAYRSTANTLVFLKENLVHNSFIIAACVDITYPPGSDSIVERNTGEGKVNYRFSLFSNKRRLGTGVQQEDIQGSEGISQRPAPQPRLPTAPLRCPSIEVASHEDWCFSSGLVNNVVQQADEFLVGESRRRIDTEDIYSSNLHPGVKPCAHPCHTDGNICCDLDLGIGLPGAPAPSAAFAASWASRVTTAVWVPAKALRRDLTASGPKLAASRWVRRASQTSSFVVTSSRSLISIAVTAERVVATPSSPMASFNLWPSSPGLAHALVSCSSRSPFVLRRTLLTLPTESCSDGSDRRSFRISEYDFGSFAFTTTTSGRGRLCAFTLGFGSGALAIGVAFFLPFFFFFLWTCCQSSSTGLEAFAASFWSLVIVLRVGVGGLLPLLPGARDARNSPFARRPGDVCTAFSIVFGQGRCSSPSSAVRQLKCIFAAFVSICFRILWMLFLGSANSIISLILSPSRSRCSSGLNVLSVLSDSTSDWISDIDADVAPDPIFLCLRPSPPSIALSCSCRRSVVSSTCELVFGFTLICYSSSSSRSPKSVTAGSQCVRVPRASAGEHRAHSVLPPTRTSLRLYLLCWCAFVPC
uniref:Uncharacterized protein n=1 Tax=Trichogramma kaykai TaxID=54128 RepID=A0ABD2X6Z1_9HYME